MNEKKARALLYARSNRACEMCDRARATEAHHRKNRSQGGRWSPENLLHLCGSCHRQVTVNPALACERGWSVRSHQDPAEVPAWVAGRGWTRLTADGGYQSTDRSAA